MSIEPYIIYYIDYLDENIALDILNLKLSIRQRIKAIFTKKQMQSVHLCRMLCIDVSQFIYVRYQNV